MVKCFVLPEVLSSPVQSDIRFARGGALDSSSDARQGNARSDKKMHVIWHDDVRMQFVLFELCAAKDGGLHTACDHWITEPSWTVYRAI